MGLPSFAGNKVQPSNNSAICDHLLQSNFFSFLSNLGFYLMETKNIY